ncbi:Lpg1974 family pore-forming outer membrane protein [Legionella fairfieldensis]|uniref:Lpg1974 family pore-forming outer membrane protein n=1 Tax=Legionella fairfieldensis TaxID=45064 RepID=UPI00049081D3|nr:Lpg1974 family pore-forming outer membrane protein [Legionella fairfieldensis]
MLKKTTIAIFGLIGSGFTFAGMYSAPPAPSCVPGDVTVPCEVRQWDIGLQALYFQPAYTNYENYNSGNNSGREIAKWGWGYRLEGSYHFNTGNDLSMTWMHYDNTTRRNGFSELTPFSQSPLSYHLTLDNKFDQANLALGQHVNLGARNRAHFYGGLQYAKIRVDSIDNYRTVPLALVVAAGATSLQQFRNDSFDGIGPVLGIDYSYDLAYGFSVTANTAFSALYGSTRHVTGYVIGPNGLVENAFSNSRKNIVPGMGAKLGLKYGYGFAEGVLHLEGGYQAINYFDAFESQRVLVGLQNLSLASSNFALYGPYFGAKWVGNV